MYCIPLSENFNISKIACCESNSKEFLKITSDVGP